MLYECAVLKIPTKKESEDGAAEELILSPVAIVAHDDKSAAIQIVAKHSDKFQGVDMARVQVLVRPFA